MLTISSELKEFKDTVSSGIDNMNLTITTLSEKLTRISSSCTTAVSDFSTYYESKNKNDILSKFSQIESTLSSIKSSITGDLKSILSKAQDIIDKVTKLEELIVDIGVQQAIIDNENNKDSKERDYNAIKNARVKIAEDTENFNIITSDANKLLSELKSFNAVVDTGQIELSNTAITIGEVKMELQGLREGEYNEVIYTAKNGRSIKTYIYLPMGANSVEGLGVTLYMGGDGSTGNALNAGVGKQLKQGAEYSGIVVLLEAENGKSYSDSTFLDASKELSDNIVKTYNANPNKVSISGYSYGGSGVQHMIERFPNYFSQAVVIAQGVGAIGKESGGSREEAYEKIKTTKLHIICGTGDSSYEELRRLYNTLKSNGAPVTCEWREGAGHSINTFYPITVDGVTYDNYVEFCLAQEKNN